MINTKKICVLSYANGIYKNGLKRLEDSIKKVGFEGDILFWTDDNLPPGSPTHLEIPFAFKPFAFEEAKRRGYTQALWIDATGIVIRPLDKIFKNIEKNGYFIPGVYADPVGKWSSDLTLQKFKITRDEAMTIPEALTFMIGLNFETEIGNKFQDTFFELTKDIGAWRGAPYEVPHENTFTNKDFSISKDQRVKGHRHEQTITSLIAHKLNMKFSAYGNFDLIGYAAAGKQYARYIPTDTIVLQNRDIKTEDYLKSIDKFCNRKGVFNKTSYIFICFIRMILKNIKTYIRVKKYE